MDFLIEVLRYCLGTETDEKTVGRSFPSPSSDWDEVIEEADWHGIVPLLYQSLKVLGTGVNITDSVLQRMQGKYLRSALENLRRSRQLSELLRALTSDGIPVIALKGMHLAEIVYGNVALRPMSDIDLLVKDEDLPKTEERMFGLGYSYGPFAYANRSWIAEKIGNRAYVPAKGGSVVEIHWGIGLGSPFNIDPKGLWERACPATIDGTPVLVLSPEDLLLHMCLHTSFQNAFLTGLLPLCDIVRIIQHYRGELDWGKVQDRIGQWGVARPVYLTLDLAKELLRAEVPNGFLERIRPHGFDREMTVRAREQIFDSRDSNQAVSPKLIRLWGSKGLEGKLNLLREAFLILKNVFLSKEYITYNYSVPRKSLRVYFYYAVSLKDILLRYGGSAWSLLRKNKLMVSRAERENELRTWLESV
ncbi:MAG: nucleotidyltransferase family protein [Deltaproteobacteria bacterium]|nr:MAG: nucleotidyltransferase family protein [Deltaproteobacteria bacterium]